MTHLKDQLESLLGALPEDKQAEALAYMTGLMLRVLESEGAVTIELFHLILKDTKDAYH